MAPTWAGPALFQFGKTNVYVGTRQLVQREGKWSLGLMPFGLKTFGLIQLVTWLNFLS